MSKSKKNVPAEEPDALFGRVASILEQARGNVVRAVNTNMVHAYWLIGREIVQELQGGEERAAYGKKIVEKLSARLTERYGKGYSTQVLWSFRQFHMVYADRDKILFPLGRELPEAGNLSPAGRELAMPRISSPTGSQSPPGFSPQLTWSHYRALMRVDNIEARDFYEREAIEGGWDKRTLERQIQSFYYERMLRSAKPGRMLAEGRKLPIPASSPVDALKNPYVLESKYMLFLPTEEQLRLEIEKERRLIELNLEEQADA